MAQILEKFRILTLAYSILRFLHKPITLFRTNTGFITSLKMDPRSQTTLHLAMRTDHSNRYHSNLGKAPGHNLWFGSSRFPGSALLHIIEVSQQFHE